jgi:hypothetical protein
MSHPDEEHHVFFAVFDFEGPAEQVTMLAGRDPDAVWLKGETFTEVEPDARRRENRWLISSGLDRFASHRDHFEKLLFKLENIREQLPLLQQQFRCGVGVSRFFYMDEPTFYLGEDIIRRYQALGLDVHFDQLGLGGLKTETPEVLADILELPDQEEH